MILTSPKKYQTVMGGVEIFSPMGILILTIGIFFTVGVTINNDFQKKKNLNLLR